MNKNGNQSPVVTILGTACHLSFEVYRNQTLALEAITKDTGELYATLSVNWQQNFEGADYAKRFKFPLIIIKDYSENEGVYKDLVDAGVLKKGGAYMAGTGGKVHVAILSDEWQEIAKQQLVNIKL